MFFFIHRGFIHETFTFSEKFLAGLILYPLGWIILYHLFGAYKNIYYKSRIGEMMFTFLSCLIGCLLLLIVFFIYGIENENFFYKDFFTIFITQFLITYLFRSILLSKAHNQLQKEKVWFNTLIIGSNENALHLYKSIIGNKEKTGYRICGFISTETNVLNELNNYIPNAGTINDVHKVIDELNIKEVIIAVDRNRAGLEKILQQLSEKEVGVKMMTDKVDILSGAVRTTNVMGTPLIMQPQVAIMALGAIKKKPAVIETPQGDLIGIRQFMFLSHSYDHRVVDGSLGGMFVRKLADYLENFDMNTII